MPDGQSDAMSACLACRWAAALPPPRPRATSALPRWVCCTAACRIRWCRKSSTCRLLIELHGTVDRNVPPAKGEELVKLGKAAGTEAEYIVYPGRHHGFDFSDTDPMTADALDRIVKFFESRLGDGRLIMEVSQPIGTNGLMLLLKQVRPGIRQFARCDSTLWTAATSAQTPRSGIDPRHRRRQSRIKIAALIDIDRAGEPITDRRLVRVRHLAPDQGCIGDLQRGRERHRLADRVGRDVERVVQVIVP